MQFTIRRVAASEAEYLSRLARDVYVAAFGHSFAWRDLLAHIEGHLSLRAVRTALAESVFLGAEAEGRLIGFVQFEGRGDASSQLGSCGDIRRLYVLPEFQRRGVGGSLLEAALSHPELYGRTIRLDVWERNEAAQRFYRKFGFQVVGAKPFVFASGKAGDDDLVMVRPPAEEG
jgi:ribosomal protein S18 acetylase RimI-like enzyme